MATLPDLRATDARRAVILAALLLEIRHHPDIVTACHRWDRRLGMREAEVVCRNLKRHAPTVGAESYAAAVSRAAAIWKAPAFQRDVTRTLKSIGFPDAAAASLAEPAFQLYLTWAADRPMPNPQPPGAPVRGPRGGNLPVWAHYFYLVDVMGWSVHGLVKALHLGMRESEHAHFPRTDDPEAPKRADAYWPHFDCNCRKRVRDALTETRRLLHVDSRGRRKI